MTIRWVADTVHCTISALIYSALICRLLHCIWAALVVEWIPGVAGGETFAKGKLFDQHQSRSLGPTTIYIAAIIAGMNYDQLADHLMQQSGLRGNPASSYRQVA